MKIDQRLLVIAISVVLFSCRAESQPSFHNPVKQSGADPWNTYVNGYYYYTNTTASNITIWKTKNLADLANAEKKIVWTPPAGTAYSRNLWAPEIHYIQGKWYVYFAADDGDNHNHRLYVLENASPDPLQGSWTFKGKISTADDHWAIDGSVFETDGQLYMIWSGWQGTGNGEQDIYIAKMDTPWSLEGERVLISAPQYPWEKHGDLNNDPEISHLDVNEGPQILIHANDIFLVYSASACWTDTYALGLLRAKKGDNLLDPSSWKKDPDPVFKQSPTNGVYGTGHNSFFKSPDGREDWILYHANSNPGDGCGGKRAARMQPFTWNPDGSPNFGEPVSESTALPLPSGTK